MANRHSNRHVKTASPKLAKALPAWLQRHSLALFVLLVALGSLRIVSTYGVFSHTSDEPAHLACGLEWLSNGTYQYETQHPPLARVAAALGPYLAGERSYNTPEMFEEGMAILFRDGHYDRTLFLARLGMLPFFWIGSVVVYLWAKKYFDEPSAFFAVFCFTFLPPILAHAGLATTDMPVTAMVGGSFLAALLWLERPTALNTVIFGAATGLAVLSKFSALPFIPCAMAAALIWHFVVERPSASMVQKTFRTHLVPFCMAVLIGFLVIWAGYRFSFGPVDFTSFRLPAPELYAGIQEVLSHNSGGHPAYLLGKNSDTGWWYYYFVALAVKTPLSFFGLALCGLLLVKRDKRGVRLALAFSLGILLFSLSSRINIGVRHILPVYMGLSIVAGAGAAQLLEHAKKTRLAGWALGVLVLSLSAASAFSHPDYLPYFNVLAGGEPERILADSDLDWGQDMKRLATRLHEVGAKKLAFNQLFMADLQKMGFPPIQPMNGIVPSPGWNAVSLTVLKTFRLGLGNSYVRLWPEQIKPTEKIGKGMWLWFIPPEPTP